MKHQFIFALVFLVFISSQVWAADTEIYECSSRDVKASLTLASDPNSPGLNMKLHYYNVDYAGDFKIDYLKQGGGNDGLIASGYLTGNGGDIKTLIQGSLTPDQSGYSSIALYTNHHLDHGFGLWLGCKRIR